MGAQSAQGTRGRGPDGIRLLAPHGRDGADCRPSGRHRPRPAHRRHLRGRLRRQRIDRTGSGLLTGLPASSPAHRRKGHRGEPDRGRCRRRLTDLHRQRPRAIGHRRPCLSAGHRDSRAHQRGGFLGRGLHGAHRRRRRVPRPGPEPPHPRAGRTRSGNQEGCGPVSTTTTSPVFVSTVKPEHRPGIVGVARSEWTKIRSLRSTSWTFLVTAVLTIGLGSLFALGRTSARPGRDPITANFNAAGFPFNALFLAQLAIGVLGVLIIATEYSSGMIRTTFTAVPQRGLVLAVKAVIFGSVTFVVALLTTFVTFFASQAILNRGAVKYGVSLSSPHALRIVIGAALYMTCLLYT